MMKALQLGKDGQLHITEIPAPATNEDEVRLRVSHCAICRTDAKMVRQGHRDLSLPRILGHEICAFDEDTGAHFVVWPGQACGVCDHCRRGDENLCVRMRIIGFHRDGGLAERIVVPSSSLIPVAAGIPEHLACLAEPLACTLNALERAAVSRGNRILIYGAGPVGLLMALAARAGGVIAHLVEKDPEKLVRSTEFRESLHIESSTTCGDSGFDAAINAAPSLQTVEDGLPRLRSGASFCLFSGITDETSIPSKVFDEIHYRQLRMVGAYGCTRGQMSRALEIIASHADRLEWVVEEVIGLERVPEVLSRVLAGHAMKYVVRISR